jgi:hypothetical protein
MDANLVRCDCGGNAMRALPLAECTASNRGASAFDTLLHAGGKKTEFLIGVSQAAANVKQVAR